MRIYTFDTTLRDGTQGEMISFSVDDKLMIVQKLDELGIDYIEGGWPGSNPRDREFFSRVREIKTSHAKLTAFGSTRFAKNPVEADANVKALIEAETPVVSIFGKSWDLHVQRALGISLDENLKLIAETVAYLKAHGREVVYDAEHFFDGYKANPEYALRTLEAAKSAGADVLCLCDTNGGTVTTRLAEVCAVVRKRFEGTLGIHPHNDSDMAVANAVAAVEHGFTHVQGTMNGYGERCGNANLCSIIANLELKYDHDTIGRGKLTELTPIAHFIADLANLRVPNGQPYVGRSAFAHKGGVHVSAVMKDAATYEHVRPEFVGNQQRVLLSDMSGRGNVTYKLSQYKIGEGLSESARKDLLERIKHMEHEGYELEAAEGTFELLVREAVNPNQHFFDILGFDVTTRVYGNLQGQHSAHGHTTATVTLKVQNEIRSATESGRGPVNALDVCLRQILKPFYKAITKVKLTDYKVRVLDSKKGTAAKVRVLVEWADGEKRWATVGVSENVIEASWLALLDAIRLELMRMPAPAATSAPSS